MPANELRFTEAREFRFAGFTLDLRQGRLWGTTGDVQLRPKAFALLAYMVQNSGRVLSKAELLDAVWPDVTVTEDSLAQCIHALRSALGDAGPGLVKTVPRRGYFFDHHIGEGRFAEGGSRASRAERPAVAVLKPGSIAVMPLDVGPSVSVQDRTWFDGVINDVISQLARLRSFDVIARGSTFALRDFTADPLQAGIRLGVDYVVAGSVDTHGEGFLVRTDLVRTDTGTILWTDEIWVKREGLLTLVGALVDRIIVSVLSQIAKTERNRARFVPDQSLTAWQAFHRGLEAFGVYSEPTLMRARAYLTRATELDPGFVRAFAALSECQACLSRTHFCKDGKAEAAAARRTAEIAMRLDEAAPSAQFAYAHARWSNGAPDIALAHARKSVELSPSFAEGFAEIGFYNSMYNDPQAAFADLARAEVLSPINPFIDSVHIDRAVAHLQAREFDEAAFWATKAVKKSESYPQMQITGAIVLAAAGRLDQAVTIVRTLRHENAVYDPLKIMKPPFNIAGPARDFLLNAIHAIEE